MQNNAPVGVAGMKTNVFAGTFVCGGWRFGSFVHCTYKKANERTNEVNRYFKNAKVKQLFCKIFEAVKDNVTGEIRGYSQYVRLYDKRNVHGNSLSSQDRRRRPQVLDASLYIYIETLQTLTLSAGTTLMSKTVSSLSTALALHPRRGYD